MLLNLKQMGNISAKQACVLAYWAHKAGAGGKVAELAVRPDQQSGKYSCKFDRVVGSIHDDRFVYVNMPIELRNEGTRRVEAIPTLPPHVCIADHFRENEHDLRGQVATADLPPCYETHVVVRSTPPARTTLPVALYVDAVPFSREDSCIGIWTICLLSHRRWLNCALRKTSLCACGCKGWCTIYPALKMLSWSLLCLATGGYPSLGPFLEPLPMGQASFAHCLLACSAACLFIKCDLMENSSTLGFPSVKSALHPCPKCFCTIMNWMSTRGLNALDAPWKSKDNASYNEACAACEIVVPMTNDIWRQIRVHLQYNAIASGPRGRALANNIHGTNLESGDRLEPSLLVPDIGLGFDRTMPAAATFWRRRSETSARHRNPLFDEELGISPDSIVIDYLHTMALGVFF